MAIRLPTSRMTVGGKACGAYLVVLGLSIIILL
jgi:hypothetical protein